MHFRVHPQDSDRVAQLKIAATFMMLGVMIGGPVINALIDIGNERGHALMAMIGFLIGLYIKRSWWSK